MVLIKTTRFNFISYFQVSACIPFLRLARHRKKVLFYCHFPDQLLTQRRSALKRLYRGPIDWFEELTTGMADQILVNSQFTAGVFKQTFPKLAEIHTDVLYPSLNSAAFNDEVEDLSGLLPEGRSFLFLSINRYERKKNLPLALQALAALKERLSTGEWERVHLVMAGGYDERVVENVDHYEELRSLVASLGLEDHVTFLRSFSDKQKLSLLHSSTCVLYTPSNEHFGIVPIEAMYSRCPVIAVNSGGPLESVAHDETGFLCEPTPECFSEAMQKFVTDPKLKQRMGQAGRERVQQRFSLQAFTEQLYSHITNLTQ